MSKWRTIFIALALVSLMLLMAACSDDAPSNPSDIQDIDMSETIQRLQQIAPEYQNQLNLIEKYNPNLDTKCSSAYPEKCIPPPPPRLTCKDVGQKNFLVLPPDPHNFDPDGNGIGCEE